MLTELYGIFREGLRLVSISFVVSGIRFLLERGIEWLPRAFVILDSEFLLYTHPL